MTPTLQAPAAPAPASAPADVTPTPRLGEKSDASRPAASDNLTGAELGAVLARNRRARRDTGAAAQPKPAGTPATSEPSQPSVPSPSSGDGGESGGETDTTHAASAPTGEASVIDALTQGAAVGGAQDPTPTAPEPAAEPDIDDILDDPESATEEQIKAVKDRSIRKLLSRVHKLTARLKEAERANPAPGKPAQESAGQAPTTGDPHVAALEQNIGLVQNAVEWARANPEGGEFKGRDGRVLGTYSAEQVEQILANAPTQLATLTARLEVRREVAEQAQQQARQASFDAAAKAYPWFATPEAPEYAEALAVIQQAPYLKQHPQWPEWVADAIAGRRARLASATAAAAPKPAARPVPPRVPPPSSSAAPRIDPMKQALADAEAAYAKSGSTDDLKRRESLRRQIRRG